MKSCHKTSKTFRDIYVAYEYTVCNKSRHLYTSLIFAHVTVNA